MSAAPTYHSFRARFRRNRPARIALWFIALALGIAIFGYWLAPDNSPDANTQIPEIALQPPGFQVEVVPVHLNRATPRQNWFSILLQGKMPVQRWIPVETFSVKMDIDSIGLRRFGQGERTEKYPLPLLLYGIQDSLRTVNGDWVFTDEQGHAQPLGV